MSMWVINAGHGKKFGKKKKKKERKLQHWTLIQQNTFIPTLRNELNRSSVYLNWFLYSILFFLILSNFNCRCLKSYLSSQVEMMVLTLISAIVTVRLLRICKNQITKEIELPLCLRTKTRERYKKLTCIQSNY